MPGANPTDETMTHAHAPSLDHVPARRGTAQSVVAAAWQPSTWLATLHHLLNYPFGVLYFIFLATGLSLGAGLLVTLVGIPILLLTGLATRLGGTVERWRV